jgi:Kef-type K+ transport system membrane component KefB
VGLVVAIVGFRTRQKKKAGIAPPYRVEVAVLLVAMALGIAVIVFTR